MRILVTGASGLLGLNLCLMLHPENEISGIVNRIKLNNVPFDVQSGDLCEKDTVNALINQNKPHLIINCAAAADVDWCEKNRDQAARINTEMPGTLAALCKKKNIKLIHISTDAVFDGKQVEYLEEDSPNPQSVYAETKLAGEKNVSAENPEAIIARVNFYGFSISGTHSLVEFFINNLSAGKQINGFVDVLYCPLYVKDLVKIMMQMVQKNLRGLYHVVSTESISKYAFGVRIAEKFGFDKNLINPISVNESNLQAKRSPLLMLNVKKLIGEGIKPPHQTVGIDHLYLDYLSGLPQKIISYSEVKSN